MKPGKTVVGLILGVLVDLAVLSTPLPITIKAGLAPLLAGIVLGLYAVSGLGAAIAAIANGLIVLAVAFGVNYLRAPSETLLALNKPGFYSFIPVIIQVLVVLFASLGTYLVKTR